MKILDKFLNKITMYRLVLYSLTFLIAASMIFAFFGLLPYSPWAILYSAAIITFAAWLTNILFAKVWQSPANVESVYITAFILALIFNPPQSGEFISIIPFLLAIGITSSASKYILAVSRKHIFNPAGITAVIAYLFYNHSATWWIGSIYLLPFVFIIGIMIIRKIQRFDLAVTFLIFAAISVILTNIERGFILDSLWRSLIHSPIIFFTAIMLTEPLTTPPTREDRVMYAAITGIIYAPFVHIGSIFSTPELALSLGNIYSYIISPKRKYMLTLKQIKDIAKGTKEFIFVPDRPVKFKPGQYMELTLGHKKSDDRGNRRYFTVASSPGEGTINFGVRFYPQSSTFKNAFAGMQEKDTLLAGQLAGDFTLPKDNKKKLVFIAGGIGITPFRSIVQHLMDINQKRDITLFYSNNFISEIAYENFFNNAEKEGFIKNVYTLTNNEPKPEAWQGEMGFVNKAMIEKHVPDFKERMFYISGPHAMVTAFEKILSDLGVPRYNIKVDFFPGFV